MPGIEALLEGVKTVWDGHFTSVPIEIWVKSSNIYGFFGLSSDLRGVLVNYDKVVGGQKGGGNIYNV